MKTLELHYPMIQFLINTTYATLSSSIPWNIPRITCISLVYQENRSDKWKMLWCNTRMRCITILYSAIENTEANTINGTWLWEGWMWWRRIYNDFPTFWKALFFMAWNISSSETLCVNVNSFVLKIYPGKYLATPNFICYITDDNRLQHSGCSSSKQPVPLPTTRPTTSLDDGEANFSVSPDSTAPRRKCVVVSKLIFWKGEAFDSSPTRLNALMVPSNVM